MRRGLSTVEISAGHPVISNVIEPSTTSRRDSIFVIAMSAGFLALSVALGILSDGVHHDDDLTHFMFARWSGWYPGYLVNVWGRPGFTAPMALVAWIGDRALAWHVARAFSAVVTLGGALTATWIARGAGLRYWRWTILLCYLQPLNVVLSYTTLTENFTALYFAAGLLLLQRRRCVWASLVFSLAFVSRLETLALLPIWWVCLIGQMGMRSRRPLLAASMVTAMWAPAVHNVLHWIAYGNWPIEAFFRPGGSTEYLPTGPLAYLPPMLLAASPLIIALAAVGAIELVRRRQWNVVAIAGGYLGIHWLITWFGVFASGGFARFAVAVSPLLAVSAAAGVEALSASMQRRERATRAGAMIVAVVGVCWLAVAVEMRAGRMPRPQEWDVMRFGIALPFAVMMALSIVAASVSRIGRAIVWVVLMVVGVGTAVQWGQIVRPLRLGRDQLLAQSVIASVEADRIVFCANPWIAWFGDHVEDPSAHKGRRLLSSMPAGTIFIWDSNYSPSDFHQLSADRYLNDPAYRLLRTFGGENGAARFLVFEKIAETSIEQGGQPYPLPLTMGRGERLGSYYERE